MPQLMPQFITALEVPADVFDRIVAMLQKHGGVDCDAFPFMRQEPFRLTFQGCAVLRREPKPEE